LRGFSEARIDGEECEHKLYSLQERFDSQIAMMLDDFKMEPTDRRKVEWRFDFVHDLFFDEDDITDQDIYPSAKREL